MTYRILSSPYSHATYLFIVCSKLAQFTDINLVFAVVGCTPEETPDAAGDDAEAVGQELSDGSELEIC